MIDAAAIRDSLAVELAASGPLTFARFAAPPNALGYCGTDDHDAVVGHLRAAADGPELVRLCRSFEGAWPYLELIASSAGIADPLDPRVVEAYWIGGGVLDRVRPRTFSEHLATRFRPRAARAEWPWLEAKPADGAVPHHSFHVLEVMPRIGMLREGQVAAILPSMGQCLIRPARVERLDGDRLIVRSRRLEMVDGRLRLGALAAESVLPSATGNAPGDLVAVHWGWSCGALSAEQAHTLDATLRGAIERANETT